MDVEGGKMREFVDQGFPYCPGIAPQQLANALREFHQIDRRHQEQQGMGMGLPITRGIINLHGGEAVLHSVRNEGTEITLRLPLAPSAGL